MTMPPRFTLPALLLGVLLMATAVAASAQHFSHTYRYTGDVEIDHIPDHDAVLASAPSDLILRFSDFVTLVKLTVKTPDYKNIDIKFRYDPVANRVFIWPLPTLPEAAYYIVDWGVIDPDRQLMQGQFLFSAGPDAQLPSSLVTEDEAEHVMLPDYRLIDPSLFQQQTESGPVP